MIASPRWNAVGPLLLLSTSIACGSSSEGDGASNSGGSGTAGDTGGAGDTGSSAGGSTNAGGSGSTATDVDPLTEYLPCADDERVGGFSVNLDEEFTSVEGRVLDGIDPARVPDEQGASGSCRLLGNPDLFCDPACGSGTVCSPDGCIDEAGALDVGTVAIEGMVDEISMTPSGTLTYRNSGSLTHPGFTPGADIVLRADGGDDEPFTLRGWGISYLEPEPAAVLEEGQPMTLTWTAVGEPGPARINLTLNVNNHGTTSAWVECDAPDSGSFDVPADILGELTAIGVSGFPTVVLKRRTMDSAEVEAGCVDLEIVSERILDVEIPGLISCTEDDDCGDLTCQPDLTCG